MKLKHHFYAAAILSIFCFMFTACGSSKDLAGTWRCEGLGEAYVKKFYDDGTCSNVYRGDTSADAIGWKIQDDGTLVLEMEWDGDVTFDPAETKEEALEDRGLYYLSGDTFVFLKYEHTRE